MKICNISSLSTPAFKMSKQYIIVSYAFSKLRIIYPLNTEIPVYNIHHTHLKKPTRSLTYRYQTDIYIYQRRYQHFCGPCGILSTNTVYLKT